MSNSKYIFIFLICVNIVLFIVFKKYNDFEIQEAKRINAMYPLIGDYKDSLPLCGIVERGDFVGNSHSHDYIVDLSNGKKFSLWGSTSNQAYSPQYIINFLEYRDSIYYNPTINGDTIFIFRRGKRYFFRWDKTLDKEGKVIYRK